MDVIGGDSLMANDKAADYRERSSQQLHVFKDSSVSQTDDVSTGADVIKPYSVLRAQIPCSSLAFTPCSYSQVAALILTI